MSLTFSILKYTNNWKMQEHLELFKNVYITMTILIVEPPIYLKEIWVQGYIIFSCLCKQHLLFIGKKVHVMTWFRANNTLNLQFCLFVHVGMVNLNKNRHFWDHILNLRMLTTSWSQIFKEGFSNYAQQTTLHGWQYVDSNRFFSKIFWIIVSINNFIVNLFKGINIWSRQIKVQEPVDITDSFSGQFLLWKSTALGQSWSIISL